ncbi:cation diffusion facilitator family transporter [Alkalihalobacterium elongatum]|uniref:cation diffusion facilitator family transporter n=1 Tax=Alkalihalobacterium elongatum TaxID=2675466 RepID=UPI001C1F3909|nr:cation diffusion facilitator family transporter [Alkalihalobacterium elongatum]
MHNSYALEKKLLKISVYGAVMFAVTGVIWGYLISSQMVMFDGLYSLISVMLSLMSLFAAQFIHKRDTKKFPFGKEMLEPIVIIIKYAVILLLCVTAVISALDAILSGGRETNVGSALVYSILSTVACWRVFVYLKKQKQGSGLIQAEANQWRMDMVLSAAVLVGFLIAALLSYTRFTFLTPYIDPLLVLLSAGYFLKVPVVEIFKALKEVLEMAPDQLIQKKFKSVIDSIQTNYHIEDSILRMSKVGSKLFIEVDFILNDNSKVKTVADQDLIREEINKQTKDLSYKKWLTVSFTNDRKWVN